MAELNRFTNENYYTKEEVQNILNIQNIDTIWNSILAFRSQFSQSLNLETIDGFDLSVSLCPLVTKKINELTLKFNRLSNNYRKLDNLMLKESFKNNIFTKNLEYISKSLLIDSNENQLKRIVLGQQTSIDPNFIKLQDYSLILNNLYKSYNSDSLDGITNFLIETSNQINNTSNDLENIYKKNIISNVFVKGSYEIYNECPVQLTSTLMQKLFSFLINNDEFDVIIKAAVTSFYINYIKPFSIYGEEILSLLLKYIISNSGIGNCGCLIPFEKMILDIQKQSNIIKTVQETSDITYYLIYFVNFLNDEIQFLIDELIQFMANEVKKEYYSMDNNLENKKEEKIKEIKNEESSSIVNDANIDNISEIKDENEFDHKKTDILTYTNKVAITNINLGLSDEEAKRLEQHLIESNPSLTQAQAYFYSKHCTLGMHYTISQFKKFVGCAYETARTSMDKLVLEGYYSKEPYKNKFLYTPIKRK